MKRISLIHNNYPDSVPTLDSQKKRSLSSICDKTFRLFHVPCAIYGSRTCFEPNACIIFIANVVHLVFSLAAALESSIDLLESLQLHNSSHQGVSQVAGPQRLKPAFDLQGMNRKQGFWCWGSDDPQMSLGLDSSVGLVCRIVISTAICFLLKSTND